MPSSFFPTLRLVCLAAVLAAVSGCDRPPEVPAVPAATTTEPNALMAVAFPGWTPEKTHVAFSEKDGDEGFLLVSPSLVVTLDGDHVVLMVEGRPADEQGNDMAGHASAGNLGAYWFTRKDGRWTKTAEQPSVAQTGFSGEVGELRRVDLGGGKVAVAVTNGSCWQGQCGQWLSLYELGKGHAEDILGEGVMLHSDALGFSESCNDLAKLEAGAKRHIPLDAYSEAVGCFDVTGEWSIAGEGKGAAPGDLVIRFTGVQTDVEKVPKEKPAAPKKAARNTEPQEDEDNEEYLATVNAVDSVLTYRYEKNHYVKVSGENPAPGI